MAVNKIIVKVDGVETDSIDFNSAISGLSEGNHTLLVEAYNGSTLVHSQSKNVSVGGAAFDPDYQAVLDYATANSIPLPDSTQQAIDNQRILAYKADGFFQSRDCVFNFEGTADPTFKLICWKRKIQALAFGSLTWSTSGVKGNGANGYINTLLNLSTATYWKLNSASIAYKCFDTGTAGNKFIAGVFTGNASQYTAILPDNNSNSSIMALNNLHTPPPFAKTGYTQIDRISATQLKLDNTTTFTNSSSGVANGNIYLFARNRVDNGGEADAFSDAGIGMFAMGSDNSAIYTSTKAAVG